MSRPLPPPLARTSKVKRVCVTIARRLQALNARAPTGTGPTALMSRWGPSSHGRQGLTAGFPFEIDDDQLMLMSSIARSPVKLVPATYSKRITIGPAGTPPSGMLSALYSTPP